VSHKKRAVAKGPFSGGTLTRTSRSFVGGKGSGKTGEGFPPEGGGLLLEGQILGRGGLSREGWEGKNGGGGALQDHHGGVLKRKGDSPFGVEYSSGVLERESEERGHGRLRHVSTSGFVWRKRKQK